MQRYSWAKRRIVLVHIIISLAESIAQNESVCTFCCDARVFPESIKPRNSGIQGVGASAEVPTPAALRAALQEPRKRFGCVCVCQNRDSGPNSGVRFCFWLPFNNNKPHSSGSNAYIRIVGLPKSPGPNIFSSASSASSSHWVAPVALPTFRNFPGRAQTPRSMGVC